MNKITRKQFKKLQVIWAYGGDPEVDEIPEEDDEISTDDVIESGIKYLAKAGVTNDEFIGESIANIVAALMNPVSRDLVAENFVEPEPEFHFVLKDVFDSDNNPYHLVINAYGAVVMVPWSQEDQDYEFIKESEVIRWGFDLSKFGKAKEK